MGVSRAPPVPGTSTLYVFIARASVVRAGLPSVVAPRHRESARSTDGCRYARAGHAARVRFTLMVLKFTKYVENDTRFIVHCCIGFRRDCIDGKTHGPHGAPVVAPRARLAVFRRRPMKYSTSVTSSRRKTRKAHFTAPSSERRKIMSAPLASELKAQYGANAVPIRVNDEVRVTRGKFKNREGKVEQVYRKKWVIHIKNITRDKVNGTFRWRRDRVARHDGDEGEDDDSRKALVRVGARTRGDDGRRRRARRRGVDR